MAENNEVQVAGSSIPTHVDAAPAGMSGSINVSVVVGTTTYTLAVSIPTSTGAPYTFSLTDKSSTSSNTIANFEFVDSGNFLVDVQMPEISGSGVKVDAGFTLKDGTVPSSLG